MSFVEVSPHYSGDRCISSNQPCTPELAVALMSAGRRFAHQYPQTYFVEVTLIEKPQWKSMKDHWWSIFPQQRFVTRTSPGRLILTRSHIRTFGVSESGELYVGRTYPEIHGEVFLSLHPILQTDLDLGVLHNELLPLLNK